MSNKSKNNSKLDNLDLTKFDYSENFDVEAVPLEIKMLTDSPDFIDFVKTISSSLDDGATFDEMLSSKIILRKAIDVLRKLDQKDTAEKTE